MAMFYYVDCCMDLRSLEIKCPVSLAKIQYCIVFKNKIATECNDSVNKRKCEIKSHLHPYFSLNLQVFELLQYISAWHLKWSAVPRVLLSKFTMSQKLFT